MGPFKGEVPVFCQIMARSAAVACAETPSHSREPGNIRVRVSFTTGAVRSAILATAGLLVSFISTMPGTESHVCFQYDNQWWFYVEAGGGAFRPNFSTCLM